MTLDELKKMQDYRFWMKDTEPIFHHDLYNDGSTYIVICRDAHEKYSVTRFFTFGNKIGVSVDHTNLDDSDLVEILLAKYSRRPL